MSTEWDDLVRELAVIAVTEDTAGPAYYAYRDTVSAIHDLESATCRLRALMDGAPQEHKSVLYTVLVELERARLVAENIVGEIEVIAEHLGHVPDEEG